jgi:succinylglutamic semialdehyde dehydrogenase
MTTHSKLFINGHWIEGQGDQIISTCPVDESVVWQGNSANDQQVSDAFAAARQSFAPWWDRSSEDRIAIARKFAEMVRSNSSELAELISRETGKPLWESETEVNAVIAKIGVTIDSFHQRRDTTSFEMGGVTAVTRFKPHGVCAVLGPFNFPAHLPNGHIAPALITGNTVVFKPSEITPAVGAWMVNKWSEAGLPQGVLNLVQGQRAVGEAIASHPQLDGLFFTGSSRAGRSLHEKLAPHPQKILALEMGGNNPLLVHETADLKAAAYMTILSAFYTAGQRCTCARRLVLVDNERSQEFLETLSKMMAGISFGFYHDDPQPFMGTVISAKMGQRMLAAQTELIEQGAQPIVGMKSHRGCDALISPGLIDVTEVANRSDDELFGPLLNVIRVKDFDEAITEANNTAYGLSAGLLSDNQDCYRQFIHQIRAGIVNWNRQTTGASGKLPFGGCGLSGNHRPSAYFAVDYCSFPVASLESSVLELPEKPETGIQL